MVLRLDIISAKSLSKDENSYSLGMVRDAGIAGHGSFFPMI
jgi:hypothetical protein